MSEYMPDRMPEDMSDRMPEDMPDRMPEDLPDRMAEDMSDRMPEDLPFRKCKNVTVGITRSKVIFIGLRTWLLVSESILFLWDWVSTRFVLHPSLFQDMQSQGI